MLLAAASLPAQGTRLWTQSHFEEFEKGTPQGVAITSDGRLVAGPAATELLTTPSSFVWAVAEDKAGAIYTGTGSPATVLRLDSGYVSGASAGSAAKTLFTSKALAVQALRVGPDGALYVATLPDGKVYRIQANAASLLDEQTAQVVFDLSQAPVKTADSGAAQAESAAKPGTQARYIWDMTFDAAGRLYIATGGPAAIYRVDVSRLGTAGATPVAEPFFTSDEQHIRCLAWDKDGNLLAGTDGSGLVYRIDKAGKAYVLFSAPRREVTAVAVGADGTIYEADLGDKSHNPLPELQVQTGSGSVSISFAQPGSLAAANASTSLPDGTEIYALTANAAPRKVWSGKDEIVYGLAIDAEASSADNSAKGGALIAFTGNRGRVLAIRPDGSYSDIAHLDAQQAVAFAPVSGGWLVGTGNTGKLYRLDDAANKSEHEYASDVLDAGATARWGRLEVDPGSRGYEIWTRSGNVEQPARSAKDWGWSAWQATQDGRVVSPVGRYLQWKVALSGRGRGDLSQGGELGGVGVNYLPVNSAPVVDAVVVVPGARVAPQSLAVTQPGTVNIAFPTTGAGSVTVFDANGASAAGPIQAQKDRGAVTARWAAHDDNGDDLTYDLYIKGDGEQVWRLLKKDATDKVLSFDSAALPDGGYAIKVVASDAPSHTPGDALSGELASDRFEVDTTPPVISGLKAGAVVAGAATGSAVVSKTIPVSFDASDATSPIAHAEYSLDAGPWQYIEPVSGLSDSKQEHYQFSIPVPVVNADATAPAGEPEHLITVRAYDRFENMAAAKAVVPAVGGAAGGAR